MKQVFIFVIENSQQGYEKLILTPRDSALLAFVSTHLFVIWVLWLAHSYVYCKIKARLQ